MMMTGAEFQCAREYLGLPATWVADKLGVGRQTIYRWEQGTSKLPQDAADTMSEWMARTEKAVGQMTVATVKSPGQPLTATPDSGFEFMAAEGFPASWQRMLCSRVAERTGRQIVWMDSVDVVVR